jgi:hypothetical protein
MRPSEQKEEGPDFPRSKNAAAEKLEKRKCCRKLGEKEFLN